MAVNTVDEIETMDVEEVKEDLGTWKSAPLVKEWVRRCVAKDANTLDFCWYMKQHGVIDTFTGIELVIPELNEYVLFLFSIIFYDVL